MLGAWLSWAKLFLYTGYGADDGFDLNKGVSMLALSKLKEKLLKKYSKDSDFYELCALESYPYVVSLGAPTSKELIYNLPTVRAWQASYESSELASYLIKKELKARGAMGSHVIITHVSFPNREALEHFVSPKHCPKSAIPPVAVVKAESQSKLVTSAPAPVSVPIENEPLSSLSDSDFFNFLDRASDCAPPKLQAARAHKAVEKEQGGCLVAKSTLMDMPGEHPLAQEMLESPYRLCADVLAGKSLECKRGPLHDMERKLEAIVGSFKCLDVLLSRIQGALYPALLESSDAFAKRCHGLDFYIRAHGASVAALGPDFLVMVQLVDYLASLSATPPIYLRQVTLPVMDTKFVERHYGIIDALLRLCLPPERCLDAQGAEGFNGFVRRWGFRAKKDMVRYRMLDPHMSNALYGSNGLALDSIVPLEALAHLELSFEHVIICENEVCYLSLPEISNTIAIFGSGYKVTQLAKLPWLLHKDVIYWGDVDSHGFNILHSLRQALAKEEYGQVLENMDAMQVEPVLKSTRVRSMLMDTATLKRNVHSIVIEAKPITKELDYLNGEEQLCCQELSTKFDSAYARLEQELIPFDQVIEALKRLLPDEHILFAGQDGH